MSFEAINGGLIADLDRVSVVDCVPAVADDILVYLYDSSFLGDSTSDGMLCPCIDAGSGDSKVNDSSSKSSAKRIEANKIKFIH